MKETTTINGVRWTCRGAHFTARLLGSTLCIYKTDTRTDDRNWQVELGGNLRASVCTLGHAQEVAAAFAENDYRRATSLG